MPLLFLLVVVLIFTLLSAHAGYVHLVSACCKIFFFLLQQLRAGTDGLSSVMDCTYNIVFG